MLMTKGQCRLCKRTHRSLDGEGGFCQVCLYNTPAMDFRRQRNQLAFLLWDALGRTGREEILHHLRLAKPRMTDDELAEFFLEDKNFELFKRYFTR